MNLARTACNPFIYLFIFWEFFSHLFEYFPLVNVIDFRVTILYTNKNLMCMI